MSGSGRPAKRPERRMERRAVPYALTQTCVLAQLLAEEAPLPLPAVEHACAFS